MSVTLEQLNKASQPDFVHALGEVYENSPWVPERAYDCRAFVCRLPATDPAALTAGR